MEGDPVVEGDGVVESEGVVEGDAVVVVRTGEAAAWAGTITEFTTGRVQDLGSRFNAAPPPIPAPIAFKSGRRSISPAISNPPNAYPDTPNNTYDRLGEGSILLTPPRSVGN